MLCYIQLPRQLSVSLEIKEQCYKRNIFATTITALLFAELQTIGREIVCGSVMPLTMSYKVIQPYHHRELTIKQYVRTLETTFPGQQTFRSVGDH